MMGDIGDWYNWTCLINQTLRPKFNIIGWKGYYLFVRRVSGEKSGRYFSLKHLAYVECKVWIKINEVKLTLNEILLTELFEKVKFTRIIISLDLFMEKISFCFKLNL